MATTDPGELERIGRSYKQAKELSDTLYAQLVKAVIDAYRNGSGTMEISHKTGQARELIRRIRVAAEKRGELPRSDES